MSKVQYKFPEVVFFQEGPGVRNYQYTSSGVKLLNVGNLQNGAIDLSTTDRYISDAEAYGKYKHFLADAGDLIIASSGIKVEYFEKKMGFVDESHLPLCLNTSTIRFKALDSDKLFIRYFMYFLQSKVFKEQLYKRITGSAQLNFGPSHLKQMDIALPPLEEQKRIAAILDKAHNIRQKREQNLNNADALIKSIFLDMFGDPVTNPKGWEVKPVIEYCDCMVPGRDKPKTFTGDIPWITIDDLVVNGITGKSKKQLGLTLQEISDVRRKTIPAGSVIMSCVGNLGICSVAGLPLVINQQLHSFQCKKNMNNFFLMFYLGCRKDYMEKMATSTTLLYMNKETCNSIPTVCPPIDLQNKFAEIVTKIEAQKAKQNQHLHEADQCFKALQQQFFG